MTSSISAQPSDHIAFSDRGAFKILAARNVDHQGLVAAFRVGLLVSYLALPGELLSRTTARASQVSAIFKSICRSSGSWPRAAKPGTPRRVCGSPKLFSPEDGRHGSTKPI